MADISALPDVLIQNRVVTDSGCWEWSGARCPAGYGTLYWQKKKMRVHRLVAHFAHGLDLSQRWQLARHKCDNPPCFNPDHIEVGTPRDNRQDSLSRGRGHRTTCKRGHPMSGDNVRYTRNSRICRTCDQATRARYEQRKQEGLIGRG